jgi:uncharacterized protein YkwD
LKVIYKVIIVLAVLLVIFFYMNTSVKENEVLKSPNKTYPEQKAPQSNSDAMPRPTEGYSTYVGKNVSTLQNKLGKPDRIGPSAYGFEWWVYNKESQYLLVGVEKNKVVQVFMTGSKADATPFKLGQTIEDIYRTTITDTEVHVKIKGSTYTFMLNEEELQTRLLIMYDGVYAQLFFDSTEGELEAVRFLDGKTLVETQPYDMTYVGELLTAKTPSSFEQQNINVENATQLAELTNVFRTHHQLPALTFDNDTIMLAANQSESFAKSKNEEDDMSLKEKLEEAHIDFNSAAENAAENYVDAPEAIHSFMNSKKHRKTMLNDQFNLLGTGAFGKNYVQIFVESEQQEQ